MDRTRRSIFGYGELDRYSLAEVVGLKVSAGVECRRCRKFAAIEAFGLINVQRSTSPIYSGWPPTGAARLDKPA